MKKNFKACWIRLVELNHILARHLNPRSFFFDSRKNFNSHRFFLTPHQYLIHGNCLTNTIFFFLTYAKYLWIDATHAKMLTRHFLDSHQSLVNSRYPSYPYQNLIHAIFESTYPCYLRHPRTQITQVPHST